MKTILKPLILLMLLFIVAISEAKSNLRVERDYGVGATVVKVLKSEDSQYYILFDKKIAGSTTSESILYLEKCDSNMNPLWQKSIDTLKYFEAPNADMFLRNNEVKIVCQKIIEDIDSLSVGMIYKVFQNDGVELSKNFYHVTNISSVSNGFFFSQFCYNAEYDQVLIVNQYGIFKIIEDETFQINSEVDFDTQSTELEILNDKVIALKNSIGYGLFGGFSAIDNIVILEVFPEINIKRKIIFENFYDISGNGIISSYFKKINQNEILVVNDNTEKFMVYNIAEDKFTNINKDSTLYLFFADRTNFYISSIGRTGSMDFLDSSNLFICENNATYERGFYTIKNNKMTKVCEPPLLNEIDIYSSTYYWLKDSIIIIFYNNDDENTGNYVIFSKNGTILKHNKNLQYRDLYNLNQPVYPSYIMGYSNNGNEIYCEDANGFDLLKINVNTSEIFLYTNEIKMEYSVTDNFFDKKYYATINPAIYSLHEKNNKIQLISFLDENENGIKESNELNLTYLRYLIGNNGVEYQFSNQGNGYNYIITDTGTYTIKPLLKPELFTITPTSYTITHTTYDNIDTVLFALIPKAPVYDVSVVMGNDFVTQPGFNVKYHITYTNNGNQRIDNLKIKAHIDSRLEIDSTSRAYTIDADTMIFSIGLLNIGETKRLFINFTAITPPNLNAGDTLINEVWASMAYTDIHLDDNYYLYKDAVLGSFDPNDKTVNREELEAANATAIAKTPLVYTIRFQNEGSYYAQTVRIYDTLPHNLDFSSFKVIAASFPFETVILQDSIVQFTFRGINLFPRDWDESKSHGYITYSVLPNADADFSEGIHNKADIVFDYNLPIGTDFASTSVKLVSTGIKNNIQATLKVYPNPANDIMYFDKTITKATATIYSSEGRNILQQNLNNNQIPIQNLPSGLYYLHLQVGEVGFHAAFVKQ